MGADSTLSEGRVQYAQELWNLIQVRKHMYQEYCLSFESATDGSEPDGRMEWAARQLMKELPSHYGEKGAFKLHVHGPRWQEPVLKALKTTWKTSSTPES